MGRVALAVVALVAALVAGQLTVGAAPAQAASSATLCLGYDGCAALGMTDHGYEEASNRSFWRMYGGHNCTNYAAFLMVRAGMKNSRPFTTSGDAWGWGHGMKKKLNGTPKVGSIAWFDGDGKDNLGHVAYVEAVLSKTEIIVSEDAWGGTFSWRVITAADGNWPTGFIHFKDAKGDGIVPDWRSSPIDTRVYTDASLTQQLDPRYIKPGSSAWVQLSYRNTGTGTWQGVQLGVPAGSSPLVATDRVATQTEPSVEPGQIGTFGFSIQMPADAANGDELTTTFQPVATGIGYLKFGKTDVTLRADTRDWFVASPAPVITGLALQGQTLTATAGEWLPASARLSYRWMRNGQSIADATDAVYRLTDKDVGTVISVNVKGTASGYIPTTRTSYSTATIASIHANTIDRGVTLAKGDQLVSSNGVYRAVQTSSGKLAVVNRFTKKVTWTTGKTGAVRTKLRADGNLVSYNRAGKVVWQSRSSGKGVAEAMVTNSGKLLLVSATDRIKWNSAKH